MVTNYLFAQCIFSYATIIHFVFMYKGTIDVSKVLPPPYGFSFLYLVKYGIKDTNRDSTTAHSTV